MIGLRRKLACRCLITWWIPPEFQLACHLPLCHKETTPNPAHVPWTDGLSLSLGETETQVHRMFTHAFSLCSQGRMVVTWQLLVMFNRV